MDSIEERLLFVILQRAFHSADTSPGIRDLRKWTPWRALGYAIDESGLKREGVLTGYPVQAPALQHVRVGGLKRCDEGR